MGREMKGETVRGIWASRGWGPGGVLKRRVVGGGEGLEMSLLLLYMVVVETKVLQWSKMLQCSLNGRVPERAFKPRPEERLADKSDDLTGR